MWYRSNKHTADLWECCRHLHSSSVQANCRLISHTAVYSTVTRWGFTAEVLIHIHLRSKLHLPFVSLRTSTQQHSGIRGHIQSAGNRNHIQDMQKCSELLQIAVVTVAGFSPLCFNVPTQRPGGLWWCKRKDEARISLMLLINKRQRRGTCYLVLDVMQTFSTLVCC